MKKYLVLLLVFMFPCIVNATSINVSCPTTTKMNTTEVCTIYIDADEEIKEFNANLKVNGSNIVLEKNVFSSNESISVNKNVKVGTFKVTSNGEVGTSIVVVEPTSIKNGNDEVISVNESTATIKVLNNDASLKLLKLEDETNQIVNIGFDSEKTLYNDIKLTSSEVTITANTNDANATVTGNGTKTLSCGDNVLKVTSVAEDKTSLVYEFRINRTCDGDTLLKGINLSVGTLSPAFDSNTKDYTVSLSKDTSKITITGIKNNDSQNISGEVSNKALEYGENNVILKVTAENGKTSEYKIVVNREDARNANTYLESLSLDNGKIKFEKDTLSYNTKVLYEVDTVNVSAKPEEQTSKVEVKKEDSLVVGDNNVTIIVTSESGAVREYKVVITRLEEGETLGDNPSINVIIVSNYKIDFKPDITEYVLKIKNEDELVITVMMEDQKNATYFISDNENLKNGSVITVTGVAGNGDIKEYKIIIKKTNYILIIGLGVLALAAVGGIVFVVVNKKKSKEIRKPYLKDDKLLSKVENQLNSKVNKNEVEEIYEDKTVDLPDVNRLNIEDTKVFEDKVFDTESIEKEDIDKVETETMIVCDICGHKVLESAEVCPYCKRKFK